MRALRIIEQEHRSLAAVLHGMLYVVREIRCSDAAPDFELLRAMVSYIDDFSEQYHHPKEDAYLLKRLVQRWPGAAPLAARIAAEHAEGAGRLRDLRDALARYEEEGAAAFAAFATRTASFAAFHWEHMRLEETEVMPLVQLHLAEDDWREVDAAFAGHTDPLLGAEKGAGFQALFRRIVDLAPPPIGRARTPR